jgi:hypothetical protein
MYCQYCGSAISDDAQPCESCGRRQPAIQNPRAGAASLTVSPSASLQKRQAESFPLAVGNESDYCNEPGGPSLASDAQMRCPFCRELILAGAKKCRHCGEFLSQSLRQSRMPPAQPPQQFWNPGIAAVLSLFVPGAGQMYKGQVGAGIARLFLVVLGYFLVIVPGLILHIICIFNAHSGTVKRN